MFNRFHRLVLQIASVIAVMAVAAASGTAQDAKPAAKPASDKVIAEVNGKKITEADLSYADQEIGRDLGQLPANTRRFALTEFLIENQLLADEALKEKLGDDKAYAERLTYWKRRALRDTYFDTKLRTAISEKAAMAIYEAQVKNIPAEDEVQARHILVEKEDQAKEIKGKIDGGEDFAELAKKNSKDPGSAQNGGMLGYFSKGQMVPVFEQTAFALKKGEISQPIKSRFGWHIIKVEDRRNKPKPKFEDVKDRILNMLVYQRQQVLTEKLRKESKVEYLDADIKTQAQIRDVQQKKQAEEMRKKFQNSTPANGAVPIEKEKK